MPTPISQHPHAGEVLREMRHSAGISRRAMAERVGCSHQHLAAIESGERTLTADLAERIARATADHILERKSA